MLWSFAGGQILILSYKSFRINGNISWEYVLASVVIFYLFFRFVFRKIVKKHTHRIMSSRLSEHCIFSFFDAKGYMVMSLMIAVGIAIRNAHLINPIYLGAFYLGLGPAILSAGIMFLISALHFDRRK